MDPLTVMGTVTGGLDAIANVGVSAANYKQQQEMFNYQKDLQQQIFGREDTAVQRRVADLKAAGLSPVLAAGSSANAGAVVKPETPQMNYQAEAQAKIKGVMDMLTQKKNIEVSAAQERLLNSSAQRNIAETEWLNESKPAKLEAITLDNLFASRSLENRLSKIEKDLALTDEKTLNSQLDAKLKQYNLDILPDAFVAKVEQYAQMIQKTLKMKQDTAYKTALIEMLEVSTEQGRWDLDIFKETGQASRGRTIHSDIDMNFGDEQPEPGLIKKVGNKIAEWFGL